jgi:DNA-binding LacI/PurR family transcriptional regulator
MMMTRGAEIPDPAKLMRPRATDVAALAKVSESAVSRTFNDGSVSHHVRQRVLAAARELGYRPNAMAAALPTGRSNVIAILMTTNTNSHFPEVLSALSHAADNHKMRVMLFTLDNPMLVSDVVDQILSYQVDAVLSLTDVPEADARILETNGVPLVLYNHSAATYPANLVSCDHLTAGKVLGEYLLSLGHRHFGIIQGPPRSVLAQDRATGICDMLASVGIARKDICSAVGDFSYDSGRIAARDILGRNAGTTALVCVNDMMAIGAIDEALAMGLMIPNDISVASFDGVPASRWTHYQLTTMRQPLPQLAEAALDAIIRLLATPGRAREARFLTCELSIGASTGPRS